MEHHCPTQQYQRRRLWTLLPQKTCRASAGQVSPPSCLQTFHIHIGIFKLLTFSLRDCHLLPIFPPLLSSSTFSTPAFSVAPFVPFVQSITVSIASRGHHIAPTPLLPILTAFLWGYEAGIHWSQYCIARYQVIFCGSGLDISSSSQC